MINSCLSHSRPQSASSQTQTDIPAEDIPHPAGDTSGADSDDMQHDTPSQTPAEDDNIPQANPSL